MSLRASFTNIKRASLALALVGGLILGGVQFSPSASAATTSAWSAAHPCYFTPTAWEMVKVLIETDSTGKKHPIVLSVTGDEHIDKINFVRENYSGGSAQTQVNHPEPNTGTWTTGNFSPQLPLVSGSKTWTVSLHRSNSLKGSCETAAYSF